METSVQQEPGAASNVPANATTLAELVDDYMAAFAGRDRTRVYQLTWWVAHFGKKPWLEITDEDVFKALERLAREPARVYMGLDADGEKIYRGKPRPRSSTTVNRYHVALMAVFTWAIKRRRAPRGWENLARQVERAPEK